MSTAANAAKIRALRASKGWSQEELAHQARLGESTVKRAENDRAVHGSTLARIATALGVNVADIATLVPVLDSTAISRTEPCRLLGQYGPLLAAICDTLRRLIQWRRGFADTFTYGSLFMRRQQIALFAPLEDVAPLAATVSLSLHRDISESIQLLKQIHKQIKDVGGALRNCERTGYRLSLAAADQVLNNGTTMCDAAELHLKRAESELRRMLNLEAPPN